MPFIYKTLIAALIAITIGSLLFYRLKSHVSPPIVIDTDVDIDDMIAISMLVREDPKRIRAITTVGNGMATYKHTAPNALKLLKFLGAEHIDVCYGAKNSLSPFANFPKSWREDVDNIMNYPMHESDRKPSVLLSHDKIIDEASKHKKIELIAMGPLTNIAMAIEKEPSIVSKISRLTIMGGAINGDGNVVGKDHGKPHPKSEYNIYLDAQAADIVLKSGIPIRLIPLEGTENAPLTLETIKPIETGKETELSKFVAFVCKGFLKSQEGVLLYFWDPVAAATVIDRFVMAKTEKLKIEVNLDKTSELYGSLEVSENGSQVEICSEIHGKKFFKLLNELLKK